MTREDVMQAVARGWCSDANKSKTMDSDLALAITDEVILALDEIVLLEKELFERIWQAIKHWDIDNGKPVPGTKITGYAGIMGDDVRLIIDAMAEPVPIC